MTAGAHAADREDGTGKRTLRLKIRKLMLIGPKSLRSGQIILGLSMRKKPRSISRNKQMTLPGTLAQDRAHLGRQSARGALLLGPVNWRRGSK